MNVTKQYDVIRFPLNTEKTNILSDSLSKYTFFVDVSCSKHQVKKAIKDVFNVDVIKINVLNVKGKTKLFKGRKGKKSDMKKAIVTIEKSAKIDYDCNSLLNI